MRRGVRLGVDVGSVRVGVCLSDPEGLLATPLITLRRSSPAAGAAGARQSGGALPSGGARRLQSAAPASEPGDDLAQLAALTQEHAVVEVIVGLPLRLSGEEGAAAHAVRDYALELAGRVSPVPVRLVDERLTTVDAHRTLRDSGMPGRSQRRVVDQVAAVHILQNALDTERATGQPPGQVVVVTPGDQDLRQPRTKGGRP